MIDNIIEAIFDFNKKHGTSMKIILGTIFTALFLLYFVRETTIAHSEEMNTVQWIISFVSIFYVCFGIPWGFSKLKMIKVDQFHKIPFIGLEIYIILKLGISCFIGTPVMIFELLQWFGKKIGKKPSQL